jgi:hypothetical protein
VSGEKKNGLCQLSPTGKLVVTFMHLSKKKTGIKVISSFRGIIFRLLIRLVEGKFWRISSTVVAGGVHYSFFALAGRLSN